MDQLSHLIKKPLPLMVVSLALLYGWLMSVSQVQAVASSQTGSQGEPTETPTPTETQTPFPPTMTATTTVTATPTNTASPTISPTPSCNLIVPGPFIVTGNDDLQFEVTNNNAASVSLTDTSLTWTDFYDPDQYVNYFKFNAFQYYDGNGFSSPIAVTSTVSFASSAIAFWNTDFDGYGLLYGQTHTIGPFTIQLTFNDSCQAAATIPLIVSTIFKPTNGQVITTQSQTNFEARSWDTGVGTSNGAGIDRMHIVILDPGGNAFVNRTDTSAPYCAFGNASPCPTMTNSQWNSLPNGIYTMIAWGRSGITGSWSAPTQVTFTLDRGLPTATATWTPTITPTPTATTTKTPTPPLITPTASTTSTPSITPSLTPTEAQGTIEGIIHLQGRTVYSGTLVIVYLDGTVLGEVSTDADASFTLNLYPGRYDLVVERDYYLDAVQTGIVLESGTTLTLPTVTLLGGDSNDSDMINILDLAFQGARYGLSEGDPGWDPAADINGDGTVNILDLTISASNFKKSSPVPW